MEDVTKKAIVIGSGVGSSVGLMWGMAPESVLHLLSQTAQNQIAQAGFFFTMAAWIHSSRVKKEIAKHFSLLTAAITNATTNFNIELGEIKKSLENHGGRIKNLEQVKKQGEV